MTSRAERYDGGFRFRAQNVSASTPPSSYAVKVGLLSTVLLLSTNAAAFDRGCAAGVDGQLLQQEQQRHFC